MTDLHALIQAGLSDRAIQRKTGIERRKVAKWRREHGYPVWSPTEPAHGTRTRYARGCRCHECREAKARYAARAHTPASGTAMEAPRVAQLAQTRRAALTETRLAATRTMARWTEDELVIALDLSHSAAEAARLLSRSKSAVEHQRAKRKSQLTRSGPLPRGRRLSRDQ